MRDLGDFITKISFKQACNGKNYCSKILTPCQVSKKALIVVDLKIYIPLACIFYDLHWEVKTYSKLNSVVYSWSNPPGLFLKVKGSVLITLEICYSTLQPALVAINHSETDQSQRNQNVAKDQYFAEAKSRCLLVSRY